MKRIIHIGDGKHIELDEGALHRPPPPPHVINMNLSIPYHFKPTLPKYVVKNPMVERAKTPGIHEWNGFRKRQMFALSPVLGRRMGQVYGTTRKETEQLWVKAREQVKKDMSNIKKAGIILDDAGEEALTQTLEIMRGPGGPELKLRAARQVLEWARAKPATSTNVTVNAAEKWLESLSEQNENNDDESTGDA